MKHRQLLKILTQSEYLDISFIDRMIKVLVAHSSDRFRVPSPLLTCEVISLREKFKAGVRKTIENNTRTKNALISSSK